MAFTTAKHTVSYDKGDWSTWAENPPYFYPEDISIVLSQEGVVALHLCIVEFPSNHSSGKSPSFALFGIVIDDDGKYKRLDDPDHLIALSCGPNNEQGAIYKDGVNIDINRIIKQVQVRQSKP